MLFHCLDSKAGRGRWLWKFCWLSQIKPFLLFFGGGGLPKDSVGKVCYKSRTIHININFRILDIRLNVLEFQDAIFTFPRTFRRVKIYGCRHGGHHCGQHGGGHGGRHVGEHHGRHGRRYGGRDGGGQGGRDGGWHGGGHDGQQVTPMSHQSPRITSLVSMQPSNM